VLLFPLSQRSPTNPFPGKEHEPNATLFKDDSSGFSYTNLLIILPPKESYIIYDYFVSDLYLGAFY
jgi:hypothetical protein